MSKLEHIVRVIARRQPQCVADYGLPPGREELRRQIALRARDWGVNLAAEDIIITHGCIEALNLCLRAVAKPGDIIALESPTHFAMLQIIESLGMKALEIPTHPRYGVSPEALEFALEREKIKACLLMPNVGNPLGSTMPDASKKRLAQILARRDIPLIENGICNALHFDPATPFAAKAFDKKDMVMLCSSFTKTIAPGFRVGWVAPGRYYAEVLMLKFVSSGGVSALLQLALAEFLESGGYDRLLRDLRRVYAEQVERVTQAVCRHFPAGTRLTRPSGGFVLWAEMPPGIDSLELARRAMKQRIGVAPGVLFSASGQYSNCLRINCSLPWSERVEGALARVGGLAHELAL
jgi:DNA-binding transcriptional MocR family regulator